MKNDSGSVMIAAVLILFITLGIGVALAASVDSQLHAAKYERNRESSFNIADAALQAQALQLGRNFPNPAAYGVAATPSSCTPASTNSYCPSATALGGGYTATDFNSTCPGQTTTPTWTTTIRDNASGEQYWTSAVDGRSAYDANNDGIVWVRSTGFVQCRKQSIVAEVRNDPLPAITVPGNVITANWFETTNQGRKVIVDTLGSYAQPPSARPGPASQPANLVVRCGGLIAATCLKYPASKGQVQPPTTKIDPGISSQALSSSQMDALKTRAQQAGTYHTGAGDCPNTPAALSSVGGAPVYIEGPCNISVSGNTSINTATTPGALIIVNGTISLGGTVDFYGFLYARNAQNSSGAVISTGGNASIQGIVTVDGNGGVSSGSSKTNIVYDSRAATLASGSGGATVAKSTWRQLPSNTP
jgi:Tfp pilus assembly protein PilX